MPARPTFMLALRVFLCLCGLLLPYQSGRAQAPVAADPPTVYRSVMIELAAPSAAEVYASHAVAAASADALASITQAQIADLTAAQDALLAALAPFDVQVIFRTQRVYNGIAVRLPAERAAAVAALPGVKAIHPLIAKEPANDGALTNIGAPALWQSGVTGLTGEGVKVAVIDTGIDYLHRNFGGPGGVNLDNDPTVTGDAPNFPGVKVAGGYDFAGNTYNATTGAVAYQPIPQPDPDPVDCYGVGHGSHVAGTIAGYGVTPDGQTYTGPYTATVDLTQLRIAPGVAPHAQLYALKVFGCSGSSEIVDLAVEWAVDPNRDGDLRDRMDILNLSLGVSFGAPYDATAVAVENAAKTGVIIVAAAGNTGDLTYAVSSPGIADHAIAVAAGTLPSGVTPAGIAVFSARGPRRADGLLKPDVTAPGVDIRSTRQGTGTEGVTLSGTSMASAVTAGALALLRQAHPSWRAEELKALLMNTAVGPLVDDDLAVYGPSRAGAGSIDLPRALASALIAYDAQDPAVVSLNFGLVEVLDTYTAVRSVRVVNKSASPITVTVGYSEVNQVAGVIVGVDAGQVITVPARGSVALPVTLTAVADQMARRPDPTRGEVDSPQLATLAEVGGYLRLTPVAAPTIQVPVYAAPQRVGRLELEAPSLDFGTASPASAVLTPTGTLPAGTFPPTETVALMGLFALERSSPPITVGPDGVAPVDDRYAAADLRYVGVAGPLDGKISFAVAAYGPWSTPREVLFAIELDVDGDESADYLLANRDSAALNAFSSGGTDEFIGVLQEIGSFARYDEGPLNEYSPAAYDTRLFNSDVMVIPLQIADLATDAATIRYRVLAYVNDLSNAATSAGSVDRTPWRALALTRPNGLAVVGWPKAVMPAAGAPTVTVAFDRLAATLTGVHGLLTLHLHNPVGLRAQALPISYAWPNTTRFPWYQSNRP